MKIAECFHGKLSFHPEFNWQGIKPGALSDYGGHLEDLKWTFPDGSVGEWREVEAWPDGSPKFFFAALGQQVDEQGDDL